MYSEDIKHILCVRNENSIEGIEDIEDMLLRIRYDKKRIKDTCAKYLGTLIPWRPFNSVQNETKWNYYRDKDRQFGWCLNPKVRSYCDLGRY